MRRVVIALVAMTCLATAAWGQGLQPQPNTAAVGFSNQSDFNILIKGYTVVNGQQRAGTLIALKKGTKGYAYELNVPLGVRYFSVYDANQPARALLLDYPVPIRTSMVLFNVVPVPGNPNRVAIVPVAAP